MSLIRGLTPLLHSSARYAAISHIRSKAVFDGWEWSSIGYTVEQKVSKYCCIHAVRVPWLNPQALTRTGCHFSPVRVGSHTPVGAQSAESLTITIYFLDGMYGHHMLSKSMDQPGKAANPARGQLKISISLFPFAPENLVSRDGFGRPVPRQPAHSPHLG